jgi:hypothetical protein
LQQLSQSTLVLQIDRCTTKSRIQSMILVSRVTGVATMVCTVSLVYVHMYCYIQRITFRMHLRACMHLWMSTHTALGRHAGPTAEKMQFERHDGKVDFNIILLLLVDQYAGAVCVCTYICTHLEKGMCFKYKSNHACMYMACHVHVCIHACIHTSTC